jgi:hypothetical protein
VVEYSLKTQRVDKQVEVARKAGARHIVLVESATDGRITYRVRRADHADQQVDSIEALTTWASSITGNVS